MSGHSKFANIKHERNTSTGSDISFSLCESASYIRSSTVTVISKCINDDCSSVRSVSFVYDVFVVVSISVSGCFFDTSVNIVIWHIICFCLCNRITESAVVSRISSASFFDCYSDFTTDLREYFSFCCVVFFFFMFDQKGQIIVDKEECELDADDLMMQALDAGAEDFSEEEDSFEILTDPNDFSEVRLALEEAGIPMASAEVTMIPQTWVTLDNEEDIKNIQKTLDLLEDDDDVQEVYHNWEEA